MRPKPELIRLGEREWLVRPLTLRQIQDIEPMLATSEPCPSGSITAAVAIIEIALRRDHPDSAHSLAEVEATAPEIAAAMAAILRLGGFIELSLEPSSHGGALAVGEA